ncbi:MAG: ParB N-terminal domain-containing protein [Candidatus Kapaibacterium sp.]
MKKIINRIISQRPIKWRELEWFQTDSLKDLSEENLEKLKNSLKQNNFVQPFNVWIDKKKKVWILDGVHRAKAMKQLEEEGIKIPDMLPANFVKCANKKEAAKLVLIYSSFYAKITDFGLREFLDINEILFTEVNAEIDLPEIDLSIFLPGETKESEITSMIEMQKDLSNVYIVIGEYRILLDREKYLGWIEEIKMEYGFDKLAVMNELKRRLKLP